MLFNTSERKGILVLLLLITGLIVLPRQFLRTKQELFLLHDTIVIKNDKIIPVKEQISKKVRNIPKIIELNSADSITLLSVRGIGPYYATKIIKYRKRLGGYYSVRQLKELNMTYFNVDSLAHLFIVDTTLIVKKTLDSMTFKEVLSHPYLEYEEVKLIFNAKNKYQTVTFGLLSEKKILPDHKLKKIKPYFR